MGLTAKLIGPEREETLHAFLLRIPGWTEEEYYEKAPEMWFAEFEDREVIMHSPVSIRHQAITRLLTISLHVLVQRRNVGGVFNGPAVVRLRPGFNYERDICVVPVDQRDRLEKERFSGTPLPGVEVISPATRHHDLVTKALNYRKHRVAECWGGDPEQTVLHQHLLHEDLMAPYAGEDSHAGPSGESCSLRFLDRCRLVVARPLPDELHCLEQILTR